MHVEDPDPCVDDLLHVVALLHLIDVQFDALSICFVANTRLTCLVQPSGLKNVNPKGVGSSEGLHVGGLHLRLS